MTEDGERKGGTLISCPGAFQVNASEDLGKHNMAFSWSLKMVTSSLRHGMER